jgi:type IV pilus assembly protein PilB
MRSIAAPPAPPPAAQRNGARGLVALQILRAGAISEATLAANGFSSIEDLVQKVAEHFRLPRMELDTLELSPALAELLPRSTAEKHRIVPTFASKDEVTVAITDPTRIELFDWLASTLRRTVTTVVASPGEIDRAIRRLYDPVSRAPVEDQPADAVSQEALLEATQIVDRLINDAVTMRASDIHLEAGERESVVRYRVDGVLRTVATRPIELHAAMVSRLKVLAQLDISIHMAPQDGRIKLRRPQGDIDLRVSVLPTYFGEKVCCRILDNTKACLPLDALGFDAAELELFQQMIRSPYGLLLVTGPTGSGKSTTLYAALNAVRSPEINIVSVEDPVEYQLPGINQVQVAPKRGLTFASALRSILRQDPNVILVGEIRDHETGVIAAEAALTGHLVMSSLHTNDAASAITRLTEMGIEPFLVAPALIGVIAQRLVRRICAGCSREYEPTEAERVALGLPKLPPTVRFRKGAGCDACQRTGYKGRVAVRELLHVSDEIRSLIGAGAGADAIRAQAASTGFRSMRFAALKLLFAGETTFAEVMRATRG